MASRTIRVDCPTCEDDGEILTLVTLFGPDRWTCPTCGAKFLRKIEGMNDGI